MSTMRNKSHMEIDNLVDSSRYTVRYDISHITQMCTDRSQNALGHHKAGQAQRYPMFVFLVSPNNKCDSTFFSHCLKNNGFHVAGHFEASALNEP